MDVDNVDDNGRQRKRADLDLDGRLAFFPLTDLGNAYRFRDRNRGKLIWSEALGWLWWTGKRWSLQGAAAQVKIAVHQTVQSIQDEAKALRDSGRDHACGTRGRGEDKREVMLSDLIEAWGRESEKHTKLNALAAQAAPYLEIDTAVLDADPFCINVNNGTLFVRCDDPRASQPPPVRAGDVEPDGYVYFLPHDASDYCTKITPCDYVPGASCERFLKFLREVQPDEAMRRQLAAWKGYSLSGDTSEQNLCVFYGAGRNGKSVFEDVCAYVAGDYAGTIGIESFLDEGRGRNAGQATPDLAKLPGVRMLRTSEPKRGSRLNESLIKLATGGEPITARHLNREFFDFYPTFKLTISGNHRPYVQGDDEGIWRRIVLVPWPVTIPQERRNRHLARELKEEASGILNWLVDGMAYWLDHGLSLSSATKEATGEYRRESDQVGRFLEACTAADESAQAQSSVLHEVFNAWSVANSLNEWSARAFSTAMAERGYHGTKSSVMFFRGLRLLKRKEDFVDDRGRALRSRDHDGGGVPIA